MANVCVEVCVDSIESLQQAISGGAGRIELCSSLALGGLSPTYGLIKYALEHASVPVYAMVRPRSGDFLFSPDEVAMMADEVEFLREQGLDGIVVGALTSYATIDSKAIKCWKQCAGPMGLTFHRAFDWTVNPEYALETLIDLGCERVLSSGGQATAFAGMENLRQWIQQTQQRLSVMPGSGVTPNNVSDIIHYTRASEVHLSGKTLQPSRMHFQSHSAVMGHDAQADFYRAVTNEDQIRNTVAQCQ
ncbi:MAG: copper homeostasis protein CutC [Vibrio sp.]